MNRRYQVFLSFALMLAAAGAARADEIDDFLKDWIKQQHVPAASIVVIKGGAVIKAQGYGLANIEHDIPARPDTVYKIGSVSKQFIAAGIMVLVQDGRVALNDTIGKYLEGIPSTWQQITVRHL